MSCTELEAWPQTFIRGANFITPDAMMRAGRGRWMDEVAYHAHMGFNMLRLWEPCCWQLHACCWAYYLAELQLVCLWSRRAAWHRQDRLPQFGGRQLHGRVCPRQSWAALLAGWDPTDCAACAAAARPSGLKGTAGQGLDLGRHGKIADG